jgi:hypothetical protein
LTIPVSSSRFCLRRSPAKPLCDPVWPQLRMALTLRSGTPAI